MLAEYAGQTHLGSDEEAQPGSCQRRNQCDQHADDRKRDAGRFDSDTCGHHETHEGTEDTSGHVVLNGSPGPVQSHQEWNLDN